MSEQFEGPVTVKGALIVNDQHGNSNVKFDGPTGQFLNIFAAGTIEAASGFGNALCTGLVANTPNSLLTLQGGLETTLDIVVQGTGHFERDIQIKGDIQFMNAADCAEDFTVGATLDLEPGTVVVLGDHGLLFPCESPYNKCVIGVVSGAGNYKPGIILDHIISDEKRVPVALIGKVYCKVDADYGSIEIGDLLTTSATPGYAMKASDPIRSFGAVIGKALSALSEGRGLVMIIVTLQ